MLLRLRSNSEQDNQWDDKAHGGLRVKETDRYYVPNLSDSLNWNERILLSKADREYVRRWRRPAYDPCRLGRAGGHGSGQPDGAERRRAAARAAESARCCGAKVAVGPKCGHHVTAATIVGLLFPPQLSYVALETDCVAGHVGLELGNPCASHVSEIS